MREVKTKLVQVSFFVEVPTYVEAADVSNKVATILAQNNLKPVAFRVDNWQHVR